MGRARPIAIVVAALLGLPAAAQPVVVPAPVAGGAAAPAANAAPAAILTLDQEALYRESLWGRRAQADLEARSRALAAENDRIAAGLEAEDDTLTVLRATLPEDEFRRRADAFDAKVQRVRQDRDQAGHALLASADADRTTFLNAALPILTALMRERGAVVLLDRRTVFLSIEQVDVTAALIARINAELGDGQTPPGQTPQGQAPQGQTPAGAGQPGDESAVPGGQGASLPTTSGAAPGAQPPGAESAASDNPAAAKPPIPDASGGQPADSSQPAITPPGATAMPASPLAGTAGPGAIPDSGGVQAGSLPDAPDGNGGPMPAGATGAGTPPAVPESPAGSGSLVPAVPPPGTAP